MKIKRNETEESRWLSYVKSNDPLDLELKELARVDRLEHPEKSRSLKRSVCTPGIHLDREADGKDHQGFRRLNKELEKELWYMGMGEKRERARKIKFGRGLLISKLQGIRNRFVTLGNTTKLGRNCWSMFVKEMRRKMRIFEYAKVEHFKYDPGRSHIHFVYRGSYLNVHELSRVWKAVSGSPIVWVKEVTRNEHDLWAYMDGKDGCQGHQKERWSYSKKWAPADEQMLLVEFCCISNGDRQ